MTIGEWAMVVEEMTRATLFGIYCQFILMGLSLGIPLGALIGIKAYRKALFERR